MGCLGRLAGYFLSVLTALWLLCTFAEMRKIDFIWDFVCDGDGGAFYPLLSSSSSTAEITAIFGLGRSRFWPGMPTWTGGRTRRRAAPSRPLETQ